MARTQPTTRTAKLRQQDLNRMRFAGGMMAVGGLVLCARLAQLQIVQAKDLRHIAERRRLQKRPLLALRGAIYDRNGKVLARSVMNYNVVIDPVSVRNPNEVAQWLAKHLELNPSQLLQAIRERQARGSRYYMVKRSASPHQVEPLRKEYRSLPFRERPVILDLEQVPAREYPHSRMAPQVLGITTLQGSRDEGFWLAPQSGVEKAMETVLAGENGIVEGEMAPGGLMIPETIIQRTLPKDGRDVRLTLDLAIQESAEMALDELVKRHRPKRALAIVLEPHTGDLLAIANRPTFDLATLKGLDKEWESARNSAVNFLYEPGSTLKPLVVAYAVERERVRLDERFHCSGSLPIGTRRIGCSTHGGGRKAHGTQTLEEVLLNSCNVATAQIGLRLGLAGVYEVFERFHLFDRTGVGITDEQVGYAPKPSEIRFGRELRTANWAFGQGLMTTPLAVTMGYAVLANEGVYRQPRLVMEPAPRAVQPPEQVFSPETCRVVLRSLVRAVEEGTGKQARLPGYWVAGKTGTAQKAEPGRGYIKGHYIASFVGVVPADRPRAVIMVLADEPTNGYYGGEVAAPAFRQIAQFLMWYWKVPPNRTATSELPRRPERNPEPYRRRAG